MRFESLEIPGAAIVGIERRGDERGFFARTFCRNEFLAAGLPAEFVQSSISFNRRRGTVRGLHFQWLPSVEGKLVRVLRGELYDVLLDLRPDSAAFLHHAVITLTETERNAVYIPPGVAHGFQTLVEDTEVYYQMTDFYRPELQSGVRWDDQAFGIRWPIVDVTIHERDRSYPDFDAPSFLRELAKRRVARESYGSTDG
jgi:dTDP-4-dehydrorhamnose 3,5-epimerase